MIDFFIKFGKKVVDKISEIYNEAGTIDGLTEKNLRAFLENKGISELLMYRTYEEDDRGVGIYTMSDGKKGFILKVNAPVFVTELTELSIISLFESIMVNGAVLQIFTFSSQNIDRQVDDFIKMHSAKPNIKNREILEEMIKKRGEYLKKWAKESMFDRIDFRLRDYVNLVSVVFPPEVDIDTIKMEYENVKEILRDFGARNFGAKELITLLREFFHNEKGNEYWNSEYDGLRTLNSQIVSGGVDIKLNYPNWNKGYVINDANYVTTLTTKQFPNSITAEEFTQLFYDKFGNEIKVPIYGPFFVSLTVLFEDIDKLKDETFAKLRHDLSELRRFDLRTIEQHPEMKERLNEVKQQLEFMSIHNEYPLKAMWSMTLFNTDKSKLVQSVASIKNQFKRKGWYLTEELFQNIALFETLFSFPLQFSYTIAALLKRFDLLFKSNNAAIAPLIGDFRGFGYGLVSLFGRSGQIQWFDPYAVGAGASNYNMAVVGVPGQGKSFTFNEISLMLLSSGAIVRIIDSLPSYKRLTQLIGGQYEDFTDKKNLCLNFFTHILTKKDEETGEEILVKDKNGREYPQIAEEEMATIIPIIALMAGVEGVIVSNSSESAKQINDSADAKFLASSFEEAVILAFRAKGKNAGMFDVWKSLEEMRKKHKQEGNERQAALLTNVVTSLKPFSVSDGMYYSYFNGVNNFKLESDFVVVELTALEKKGVIYPIVMMAIANMIVNEFYEDMSRKKILIIDEFWKYKDNLIVGVFTEELARKVRKSSGSLTTITQYKDEYNANSRMKAVWDSSAWKFVLGKQDIKTKIGAFADKLLRTVSPHLPLFGEFAIFNDHAMSISRLKVDPLTSWLYRTDQVAQNQLNAIKREFNLNDVEATKFLAYKDEHPLATSQEILKAIGVLDEENIKEMERKKKEREEFVFEKTKDAIELENIRLFAVPIADENKDIVKYEITSKIIDEETGEELSVFEIFDVLRKRNEIDLIKKYDEIVFKKAIQLASFNKKEYMINMSFDTFMDNPYVLRFIDYVNEYNSHGLVSIEINFSNIKEDIIVVNNIIEKFKNYNVKVYSDNIDTNISYAKVLEYDVDGFKIDGKVVRNTVEDETVLWFVEMMVNIANKKGLEIIFVSVADEEIFDICLNVGGKMFEGFYFGEPELLI